MLAKSEAQKEFKLEDHLLLAQTIASTLGISNLEEISQFSEDTEGFESDGRSKMYYSILKKSGNKKIPELILQKYDSNIRELVERLKRSRKEELTLKYYQYLSVLFAEIYLDNYFKDPKLFPVLINRWNKERGSTESIGRKQLNQKIAYWMATGSGKTLIMHLNYWQFLNYNKGPHKLDYDNIILVTSDDNMSEQHREELKKSGIPAELFDGTTGGYFPSSKDKVKIISIHKLKLPGEKTGQGGVTIDVSAFGTKNLVFIDEGHKGQKSEDAKWKTVREKLAENGFIWEYSATFGQTITSEKSPYLNEYKYSILFDYSYKFFHQDGYGKDFQILNLNTTKFKEQDIPTLLLANALDYFEQLKLYLNVPNLQEYKIEKPLWIFVGSKVNAENSDILQVVRFINYLLRTDRKTIVDQIRKLILLGESGIIGSNNRDAFARRYPERDFAYLRELVDNNLVSIEQIYSELLSQVFQIPVAVANQSLELYDIKNSQGEIGLKSSSGNQFFGVINIGDKSSFIKSVQASEPLLKIREDAFQDSLFDSVSEKTSTINLLLGAKKFIEGWNSYRVSNMCLLNIGKQEGPQIIQLFGRGVRLKGKNYSLKRSSRLVGPHPNYISTLETLKIFGVQANYLQTFKEYIEQENVPIYDLVVKTTPLSPFPSGLNILSLKEGWTFKKNLFYFRPEVREFPIIDLMPKMIDIDSRNQRQLSADNDELQECVIPQDVIDILDWNEIYYQILEYKRSRGLNNIYITKEALKHVVDSGDYKLYCHKQDINPKSFAELERTQEIILIILRKRLDQFYKKKRLEEEIKYLEPKELKEKDEMINVIYNAKIKTKDPAVVRVIEEQANTISEKNRQSILFGDYFIKAYFDNHLYQPLLSEPKKEGLIISPTGLNWGETKFVNDLQEYLLKNKVDREIYLLRNLTRGKGVGFFEENRFYPDFILWLKCSDKEKIVFIDPKGISRLSLDSQKLSLHKYLRDTVQPRISQTNLQLDAFIISVTAFDLFRKISNARKDIEELAVENHLLFIKETEHRENQRYLETLFSIILA